MKKIDGVKMVAVCFKIPESDKKAIQKIADDEYLLLSDKLRQWILQRLAKEG